MIDLNKLGINVEQPAGADRNFPDPSSNRLTASLTQRVLSSSHLHSNASSISESIIPSTSQTNSTSSSPTKALTSPSNSSSIAPHDEGIKINAVIGAGAGVAFLFIAASTFWFFIRRRKRKMKKRGIVMNDSDDLSMNISENNTNLAEINIVLNDNLEKIHPESKLYPSEDMGSCDIEDIRPHPMEDIINQREPLTSHPSYLSAELSLDSKSDLDEQDSTHQIADEFDQYKNQNLEKMRAEVEGNVTNMDDMMSHALTKALMDDYVPNSEEMMWGGFLDSMEIEASVLCETTDWFKRKEGASIEEKRSFMQEMLNKMVSSVRKDILAPEHASRAIHGSAALLGLQLAGELPETTIIITSMRKKAKNEDLFGAFKEFGEIEGAAVSANNRGFGIVRYKSTKSVLKALDRARTDEIVVQDVSVNIQVLKASVTSVPNNQRGMSDVSLYNMGDKNNIMHMRGRDAGAMEAHHHPGLETIGYPDDSLGRASSTGRSSPNPSSNHHANSENDGSVSVHSSSRSHSHYSRQDSHSHDNYRGRR